MSPHWLLRLTRWLRHPPPPRRLALIAAVVALCLALAGIERFWGWPEALGTAPMGRGPLPR